MLKEHNTANILKLESCAKELKEKNKELEQLTCLLEDETISTFEDGKYVDEVREVIMDLLAMNVSMSKDLSEDSKKSLEQMGNFYCKLHLLVNLGEEANKALKLFEHAATEGRNH